MDGVVHRRSGTTSVVVVWSIAGTEYIVWVWWCGTSLERNEYIGGVVHRRSGTTMVWCGASQERNYYSVEAGKKMVVVVVVILFCVVVVNWFSLFGYWQRLANCGVW